MRFCCTLEYHQALKMPRLWWSELLTNHRRQEADDGARYLEWAECSNCKSTLLREAAKEQQQ